MTKQLRWLHISDIHFKNISKLDQKDAFLRIRNDVKKRKSAGCGPNLIFVTGDLTHSGKTEDFKQVNQLLAQLCDEAGIPRKCVFFCSGNHDSDISLAPVLIQGCWVSFTDISAFQRFLNSAEYSALKERQAAYRSFVRNFRGDSGNFDKHELHAASTIPFGDMKIVVVSVNSSLLAEGGLADQGRLQLCIRSLEDLCAGIPKNDLVFALMHHPFEWLTNFEADRAEAVLFNSADVLLRGHLHQPKLSGSFRGGIVSAAGAVWEVDAYDYEYGFGCLTIDTLSCKIESVRFVQSTGKWMSNSEELILPRDRDEMCTPAAILKQLRDSLKFPAQVAAALSGYTSELMITSSGTSNYVSTERILAESTKAGHIPAAGIIRVGRILMFYGHERMREVLHDEMESLVEYDKTLQQESKDHPDVAFDVRYREAAAEKLTRSSTVRVESWTTRLLERLVAEGNAEEIMHLRDDSSDSLLNQLKANIPGRRDPYDAWCAINGPDFDYVELEILTTRLAVKGTFDLAALALDEASKRFPSDSRRLDAVAKIIATELGNPTIYTKFQKAVKA